MRRHPLHLQDGRSEDSERSRRFVKLAVSLDMIVNLVWGWLLDGEFTCRGKPKREADVWEQGDRPSVRRYNETSYSGVNYYNITMFATNPIRPVTLTVLLWKYTCVHHARVTWSVLTTIMKLHRLWSLIIVVSTDHLSCISWNASSALWIIGQKSHLTKCNALHNQEWSYKRIRMSLDI